jgi:hypothetical protein
MTLRLLAGALLCVLFASNADARPKHHHKHHHHYRAEPGNSDLSGFFGLFEAPQAATARPARRYRTAHRTHRRVHEGLARVMAEGAGRVVAHPAGCPSRAFCGCGAAVRIFGRPIRSLWLAANWFRFPRTSPAPGTVAVRHHHVFVLERHVRGSTWIVYDANSGRHRTRVHPRSIAGYSIVNPHGSRMAMQ